MFDMLQKVLHSWHDTGGGEIKSVLSGVELNAVDGADGLRAVSSEEPEAAST